MITRVLLVSGRVTFDPRLPKHRAASRRRRGAARTLLPPYTHYPAALSLAHHTRAPSPPPILGAVTEPAASKLPLRL